MGQGQALSKSLGRGTMTALAAGSMEQGSAARRPRPGPWENAGRHGEGAWVTLEPRDAVGHLMQGWASHPRRSCERLEQAQGISSLSTLARANTDTSGRQHMGAGKELMGDPGPHRSAVPGLQHGWVDGLGDDAPRKRMLWAQPHEMQG